MSQTCKHQSGRRIVVLLETQKGGEWIKAAEHEYCADCFAVLSLKDFPGAFLTNPTSRERIIRDDRPKQKETV